MRSWCAVVVMLGLLTGCGEQIEPGRTTAQAPVITGLGLARVASEPIAQGESFVGSVESFDRGVLAARIAGRVAEVKVNAGDQVRRGELLLTLADNQASDQLHQATAALAAAEGNLAAASAELELAAKTQQRYANLLAAQAVTRQEMDSINARLEQARQGVRSAEGMVQQAAAGQAAAEKAVGWSRILAPYDSQVIERQVEVGSTVLPGMPLLTLDRQGGWRVRAAIPESLAGRFQVGERLVVEIPARQERIAGTLREIVASADPRSRSFEIKLDLDPAPGLSAGLFARVQAPGVMTPALLVPARALVERGQLVGVYLVTEGRLSFRLVRLGRRLDDRVEILSGLQGGEQIVVDGVERAKNGARVEG
ncbi:efflux RND transporter periplasmic adaptor subunit [Desulfuromonas carbonis]|uniref:efflux RND transporter periplasmic adaptor subunit n=1 Tax=Desulfuromonas sp. DDH964 TaxID=1823759 RepID=UPI00078CE3BB|nr:efflux RND transporter periplasmic adaptor subunit [Desulfuromonas sp. DDH964]AMV73930.1 RND family efflux pump membrane fusion lipoprotein [Desulfuromonas sp. DDH964]